MVEKLKSALKRIHWWLALRALCVGALSLLLPPAWFVCAAFLLYFFPTFRFSKPLFPFVLILFFALTTPPFELVSFHITSGLLNAGLLSLLCYIALGVRSLVFIDRASAYEAFSLLSLFWLSLRFSDALTPWSGVRVIGAAILFGGMIYALARGFAGYSLKSGRKEWLLRNEITAGVLGVLGCEAALAVLFLPLQPAYRAALLFLIAGMGMESGFGYMSGTLSRRRLLVDASVCIIFFFAIVGSASWGL